MRYLTYEYTVPQHRCSVAENSEESYWTFRGRVNGQRFEGNTLCARLAQVVQGVNGTASHVCEWFFNLPVLMARVCP